MRKIYLLMLPALLSGMTVTARSLSPSEALGRVAGDMQLRQSRGALAPVMTVGTDGAPALYVFNRPEGGWMIVSADDVAAPVIGFSDSDSGAIRRIFRKISEAGSNRAAGRSARLLFQVRRHIQDRVRQTVSLSLNW